MASKTTVTLADDIDGGRAVETVLFSLSGTSYEIDLSKRNAVKLRKALEPFIAAGRKVGGSRSNARARTSSSTRRDAAQTKAIKDWGRKNGFQVAERGRLSQALLDAYASKR
jgi:Lsr2